MSDDFWGWDYEFQASLAEAWHVDGHYKYAVKSWEQLAEAGYLIEESTLKAAISNFAFDQDQYGLIWLEKAKEVNTSTADIFYVLAQYHWRKGEILEAIRCFRKIPDTVPEFGMAANALGVLWWQLGHVEDARQQFKLVLSRDPSEANALINLVSINFDEMDPDDALAYLRRSISIQPHRLEPFVLYARICRRILQGNAQNAMVQARLRKSNLNRHPSNIQFLVNKGYGTATVRGIIEKEFLSFHLSYCLSADEKIALPNYLVINSGYKTVEIAGEKGKVAKSNIPFTPDISFASNVSFFCVPRDAWERDGNNWLLDVMVMGMPIPPFVAFTQHEIEFDKRSGWLPVLFPVVSIRWNFDIRIKNEFNWSVSSRYLEAFGIDFVALSKPSKITEETLLLQVDGIGRIEPALIKLACDLVIKTVKLWTALVGTTRRKALKVIVVDRPNSLLCYARSEYIRLSSGIFSRSGQMALICHEVGHLWWGIDVIFSSEDSWLEEALAEYSLHLAEQSGLLSDYLISTLNLLMELGDGKLPDTSMERLGRLKDNTSAYILRAKGGFVISMLHRVMGDEAFRHFMVMVYQIGETHRFNTYAFFALASRVYGATLNWFTNQWVYVNASMEFTVEDVQVQHLPSIFRTSFQAECIGIAVPGAPVEYGIETEGGAIYLVELTLGLGHVPVVIDTPSRPTKIIADPYHRWYAESAKIEIQGKDVL